MPSIKDTYLASPPLMDIAARNKEHFLKEAFKDAPKPEPLTEITCRATSAKEVATIVESLLLMTPHGRIKIEPGGIGDFRIRLRVP